MFKVGIVLWAVANSVILVRGCKITKKENAKTRPAGGAVGAKFGQRTQGIWPLNFVQVSDTSALHRPGLSVRHLSIAQAKPKCQTLQHCIGQA